MILMTKCGTAGARLFGGQFAPPGGEATYLSTGSGPGEWASQLSGCEFFRGGQGQSRSVKVGRTRGSFGNAEAQRGTMEILKVPNEPISSLAKAEEFPRRTHFDGSQQCSRFPSPSSRHLPKALRQRRAPRTRASSRRLTPPRPDHFTDYAPE